MKRGGKAAALRATREALATQRSAPRTGPMDAAEARDITERINTTAGRLCDLLEEARERRAWAALGYASWREYATAEFSISQSRAYQLLGQARVQGAIREAANSTDVEISEPEARDIKPRLSEVTDEIRERVGAGEDPSEVVPDVVEKTRETLRATPTPEPESPTEPSVDPVAEWERAEKEVERLTALVESLQSNDLAQRYTDLSARYAQLEGRLQQEIRTRGEAVKQAARQQKLLREIAKEAGVQGYGEIVPAITALKATITDLKR